MAFSFVSSMKSGRADKFLGDLEESAYIMLCLCPYPTHQESNETLGEPEVNPMPWLAAIGVTNNDEVSSHQAI
jgi:hypothetical protein